MTYPPIWSCPHCGEPLESHSCNDPTYRNSDYEDEEEEQDA